ncbi:MAG: hypothetical protein QM541_16260 [Flavobacterium sp.]|nr:hypothetical protein [Flavobacterium sp.]
MKLQAFFALFSLGFLSCNSAQVDSKKSATDSLTYPAETQKTVAITSDLKDKILGIWGNDYSENAVFEIRKDSIYYVDQFETYKYILKDSIITIFYRDYTDSSMLSFKKDTLVMESNGEKSKFWKFTK